jgi:hypothetical protein
MFFADVLDKQECFYLCDKSMQGKHFVLCTSPKMATLCQQGLLAKQREKKELKHK